MIKIKPKSSLRIFRFGKCTDGNAEMRDVLGGKGANLAEMSLLGMPVPHGFTIPCEASIKYLKAAKVDSLRTNFLNRLRDQVQEGLEYLAYCYGRMPLVSVRSGARVSMPGMMDTILNVGITSTTLPLWEQELGARAARDSYRRLIQMYGSVAMGIPLDEFERELNKLKVQVGATSDTDLTPSHLSRLILRYLDVVEAHGQFFPDTIEEQLMGAIVAVFRSWDNPRAIEYRRIHDYPDTWGTAVTIQSMVFGNTGEDSCTGVLFSRDPSTGEPHITGEFLVNAQGEDVVAGIRTPEPLEKMQEWNPKVFVQLTTHVKTLEQHYKDMQDVEFTVENGTLYILQTRNGKRSPEAAFRIAYDLVKEGVITKDEALARVSTKQLMALMRDRIDPSFTKPPTFTGIAAGGGLATGVAVFSSADAINCTSPCILIRRETDPDDIAGMNAAVGVLTSTGGLTSHAAVVARGLNKACVVGATSLIIHPSNGIATIQGTAQTIIPGDKITIDGATGRVWLGVDVPVIPGGKSPLVKDFLSWVVEKYGHLVERLEWDDATTYDELVEVLSNVTTPTLYIDTALIEGGDMWDAVAVFNRMSSLGKALRHYQGDVIVDLSTLSDHMTKEDRVHDYMFDVTDDDWLIEAKIKAMIEWEEDIRDRTAVRLPPRGSYSTQLADAGIKVIGRVSTVEDLLNAAGPVEVDDYTLTTVFGSKTAYETIIKLLEEHHGKHLTGTLPTPAYWYEYLDLGEK